MQHRKLPLERFSPSLRYKLEGHTAAAQEAILKKHLTEIRKQLAKEGKRKFATPILGGKTDAKKITQIINRWKSMEIKNLIREGKKPQKPQEVELRSHTKFLRKTLSTTGKDHPDHHPTATQIALRFITREVVTPLKNRNYPPEVARTAEQLIAKRARKLAGLSKPISSPTISLIIKAINVTGSERKGIALIKYLSNRTQRIKRESQKGYLRHKSDAFLNIASEFEMIASYAKIMLTDKKALLEEAMEEINHRKEALREVKAKEDHAKYKNTIKFLENEINEYSKHAKIFAQNNNLHLPEVKH